MIKKPNFLYIGPDKTGSSWLFELLRSHPECFVPACKDIYFFDRHYSRGLDWYLSFFKNARASAKAIGELSHDYLFSEDAANRIAHDLPQVKLITSLRHPIERTYSHYLYMVRSGQTRLTFEEALILHPELIKNSMYYSHLSKYLELFPAYRIKVLWFDDLQTSPRKFAKECLEFLGIGEHPNFDYSKRIRQASVSRNYLLARLAKAGANSARELRLERLVGFIKHSRISSILYRPYAENEKPRMNKTTALRLLDLFSDDISRLECLVQADLLRWKRVDRP